MDINDRFIADCQAEVAKQRHENPQTQQMDHSRSDQIICEAEASKERIYHTPGNYQFLDNVALVNNNTVMSPQVASVDENYLVTGAHVEVSLQDKMIRLSKALMLILHAYCLGTNLIKTKIRWN